MKFKQLNPKIQHLFLAGRREVFIFKNTKSQLFLSLLPLLKTAWRCRSPVNQLSIIRSTLDFFNKIRSFISAVFNSLCSFQRKLTSKVKSRTLTVVQGFLTLNAIISTASNLTVHEKKIQDLPSILRLPYCTTVLCKWSNQSNQLHNNGDLKSHQFQNSVEI